MNEMLNLLKENNLMLKEIIRYINHINANYDNENADDFMRNIIANIIGDKITGK